MNDRSGLAGAPVRPFVSIHTCRRNSYVPCRHTAAEFINQSYTRFSPTTRRHQPPVAPLTAHNFI